MKIRLVPAFNVRSSFTRDLSREALGSLMKNQVMYAAQEGREEFSWILYSSEDLSVFESRVAVDAPVDSQDTPPTFVDTLLQPVSQSYTQQKFIVYPLANFAMWATRRLASSGIFAPGIYQASSYLPGTQQEATPYVAMELFVRPDDLTSLLQVFDDELRDCKECGYFHVYYLIIRSIMPDEVPIWMSPFQEAGPRISVSLAHS
mmetsp:Transcript_167141/g.536832  ORF Transcript_167141/g.536832 Transcript_167141/m.536832 type:complete len:204 (-) Transcript_167141:350-961(-)